MHCRNTTSLIRQTPADALDAVLTHIDDRAQRFVPRMFGYAVHPGISAEQIGVG
jgi:hypothetical protein